MGVGLCVCTLVFLAARVLLLWISILVVLGFLCMIWIAVDFGRGALEHLVILLRQDHVDTLVEVAQPHPSGHDFCLPLF